MTKQPKITDFKVYPESGMYMAEVSDDLDIFHYDFDLEGERYLTRIAIAVDKNGMNLGDLHSINYTKLMDLDENSGPDAQDGFYVIKPLKSEVKFIPGTFNDDLIPYLLTQKAVYPKNWKKSYDSFEDIPNRPSPTGFSSQE